MLNIVIPMAGAGSRFAKAGYIDPKPLIKVNGVPMIKVVINNLRPSQPHRFIFICQNQHIKDYGLVEKFSVWAPGAQVVGINEVTDGAACTVLAAADLIANDAPLMIANSDQYVDIDIDAYLHYMQAGKLDGLIMTMKANDPKWSFAAVGADGYVTRVAEKEVISDEATVGIYNFHHGIDFVHAARAMIEDNDRSNGEFYVAPVYNRLIARGKAIGVYNVGAEANGMYGLGVPADLSLFLTLPVAERATGEGQ